MEHSMAILDKIDQDIAKAVDEAVKQERAECLRIALEWAIAFSNGNECDCEQAAWRIYEDIKTRDELHVQ